MQTGDIVVKNDFYAGFIYSKIFDPFTTHMRDKISCLIPEDVNILDVGCGTGYQLLRAASKIRMGTGIDLADRMIAYADKQRRKANIDHISFDLGSAVDLTQYDDSQFDLATISLVLHEMDTELRIHALKEMMRVSDRLIVADYTASPNFFCHTLMHLMEMTAGIFHYHLFRTYMKNGGAAGLFQKVGLKMIQEETTLLGMVRIWVCEKE